MVVATDGRRDDAPLREAARSPDEATRIAGAWGLARLHDPAAAATLRAGLRDPSPRVRDASALGLAAFEKEAPAGSVEAILGALATETDPGARGERLWDLGRLGGDAGAPILEASLGAADPRERAGACRGLAARGLRGDASPASAVIAAAGLVAIDPDVGVRRACVYAIARAKAELDVVSKAEVTTALAAALHDRDEDVRAMVPRALTAHGAAVASALEGATHDPSSRVQIAAFRALASRAPRERGDSEGRAAFMAAVARLAAEVGDAPLEAPAAVPLFVALEEARAATPTDVLPAAERVLATLGRHRAPSRLDGLVHCRAAVLADLAHGWPARAPECGLGKVTDAEKDEATVAVLAHLETEPALRAAFLGRLYAHGGTPTREAVLGAAPAIADPAADALLVRALGDHDVGVISAALEAAPEAAARLHVPAATMRAAETTLAATDEVEGLAAWCDLAGALHDAALAPTLRELAVHPCRAVRERAVAALDALGVAAVHGEARPVANVIPARAVPPASARWTATIELDGGRTVELELWTGEAPTTVARFVSLARRGFFDGLTFHRVVPGFVVQGGDPRGDGFGGPGWTQRCEDGRARYERGVVGMALAGRDTGGSQFFVTTGPAYHLDAHYTAFGRVTRGMEHVDAILQGDHMVHVRVGTPGG